MGSFKVSKDEQYLEYCCGLTQSYLEVSARILGEYKIYRGKYVSKQS